MGSSNALHIQTHCSLHWPQQLVSLKEYRLCNQRAGRSTRMLASEKPDVPWVLMGRTVNLDAAGVNTQDLASTASDERCEAESLEV